MHTCSCGSGKSRRSLYDARNIFCCYICDTCEKVQRSKYRAEIFTDSNYETTEEVEDDY